MDLCALTLIVCLGGYEPARQMACPFILDGGRGLWGGQEVVVGEAQPRSGGKSDWLYRSAKLLAEDVVMMEAGQEAVQLYNCNTTDGKRK